MESHSEHLAPVLSLLHIYVQICTSFWKITFWGICKYTHHGPLAAFWPSGPANVNWGPSQEEQQQLGQFQASPGFEARDPEIHEAYFKTLYGAFFRNKRAASGLEFGFTPATARYALEAEEQLVVQLMALDPMASLSNVASPTLVVHAEQDLIPEDFSRLLADRIPGARLVVLEGVGHFAYLEDPTLFDETVVNFLQLETNISR